MLSRDTAIVIGAAAFLILFGIFSSYFAKGTLDRREEFSGSWSCTADVQACPDGTTVNRVPPYCQFAECPR